MQKKSHKNKLYHLFDVNIQIASVNAPGNNDLLENGFNYCLTDKIKLLTFHNQLVYNQENHTKRL